MLRCSECGGQAIPGLAHLHGDPCRQLCYTCTATLLEQRAPKLWRREAKRVAEKRLLQAA